MFRLLRVRRRSTARPLDNAIKSEVANTVLSSEGRQILKH